VKWTVRKVGASRRAKHFWHLWFAWHPVRLSAKGESKTIVWLEYVNRKGIYFCGWDGPCWEWTYAIGRRRYWSAKKREENADAPR
jgi:hypothetical protein